MTGVVLCDNKFGRPCLGTCFVASNSVLDLARSVHFFMYGNIEDVEQMTCHGSRGALTTDIRVRFDDTQCGVYVGQNGAGLCVFSEFPVVPVCILPLIFYVHSFIFHQKYSKIFAADIFVK